MWKAILRFVKATISAIAGFAAFMDPAYSQQNITTDKDNTHPEITTHQYTAAKINSFSAIQMNGYNEIQWSALAEQDTRRYIVEYSIDGIDYQTAGELLTVNGFYKLKHYTPEIRTFLYRIRIEKKDGRFSNSPVYLLEGTDIAPVKIYPTIVEGNILNVQMALPVLRISVVSAEGRQIFAKNLGGTSGAIQLTIPLLGKGIYYIVFYGHGWQSSSKFVIAK